MNLVPVQNEEFRNGMLANATLKVKIETKWHKKAYRIIGRFGPERRPFQNLASLNKQNPRRDAMIGCRPRKDYIIVGGEEMSRKIE